MIARSARHGSLVLLLVSHLWAEESQLKRTVLFRAGDDGIAAYRIPGVVVTPKGSALAYCEARREGRSDFGEIEIRLRRSTDGGRTWEPSRQIAHLGERIEGNPRKAVGGEKEQTVGNPVAIVDRDTGAVEFLYCVNYSRCFSMRSLDDGQTWTEPVEITGAFEKFREHHDWKVIATGPGHGIQLRSGRLVVPVWLAFGKEGDHRPSAVATIYSDDHGRSWTAGEIVVPPSNEYLNPSESILAELSDGRVMMVTRSESLPNRKLVSFSPNGATQWSQPAFQADLWEPRCMASLIAHPAAPGTLLFSSPHSLPLDEAGREIPGGKARRKNLSIKLSRDDGRSWPIQKTLEKGASAYSDLAALPDGSVLCFYEAGSTLTVARFNLSWLMKEEAADLEKKDNR